MKRTIMVDPQRLLNTSGRIDEKVNEYRQLYGKLYTEVERLSSAWQGKDNQAFTQRIKEFEEDFRVMASMMEEYGGFLNKSSMKYSEVQQSRYDVARGLRS